MISPQDYLLACSLWVFAGVMIIIINERLKAGHMIYKIFLGFLILYTGILGINESGSDKTKKQIALEAYVKCIESSYRPCEGNYTGGRSGSISVNSNNNDALINTITLYALSGGFDDE